MTAITKLQQFSIVPLLFWLSKAPFWQPYMGGIFSVLALALAVHWIARVWNDSKWVAKISVSLMSGMGGDRKKVTQYLSEHTGFLTALSLFIVLSFTAATFNYSDDRVFSTGADIVAVGSAVMSCVLILVLLTDASAPSSTISLLRLGFHIINVGLIGWIYWLMTAKSDSKGIGILSAVIMILLQLAVFKAVGVKREAYAKRARTLKRTLKRRKAA